MAIISGGGVKRIETNVNDSSKNASSAIENDIKNFGEELSQIWESKSAQEFAQKAQQLVEDIWHQYQTYIDGLMGALNTNIQNYNMFNHDSVGGVSLAVPNVILNLIETIKDSFPDGSGDSRGIKDGRTATEAVTAFEKLQNSIEDRLSQAESGIVSSDAFDEDELQAIKSNFSKMKENLKTQFNQLTNEVRKALQQTDEEAARLKSQNISNVQ